MVLNTNNDNVFQCEMTVTEARELAGDVGQDALDTALDEAQAKVFTGEHARAFVVIEIVKD